MLPVENHELGDMLEAFGSSDGNSTAFVSSSFQLWAPLRETRLMTSELFTCPVLSPVARDFIQSPHSDFGSWLTWSHGFRAFLTLLAIPASTSTCTASSATPCTSMSHNTWPSCQTWTSGIAAKLPCECPLSEINVQASCLG